MKLSLITTLFNRRQHFLTTLKTIALTEYPHDDFEVIALDDASKEEERVDDLINRFNFNIYLTVIKPEEKTWQEPIAWINKAIRESSGEIIIYQNGECCHVGDVISYAVSHVEQGKYLTFACFNANHDLTIPIQKLEVPDRKAITNIIGDPPRCISGAWSTYGAWWYNHSLHRPVGYYFCASLTKQDYLDIGGINEAFQEGIFFADNEFMLRVNKKMEVVFVDDPFVVHQHHVNFLGMRNDYRKLKRRNAWLFREIVERDI